MEWAHDQAPPEAVQPLMTDENLPLQSRPSNGAIPSSRIAVRSDAGEGGATPRAPEEEATKRAGLVL